MSDTVVVMADGNIQQIGSPVDIYNEPENAFVADFIGESNILDGIMLDDFKVKFSGHIFQCVDKGKYILGGDTCRFWSCIMHDTTSFRNIIKYLC